jgi:hypothetical protein
MPKRMLEGTLYSKRRKRIPRIRWLEDVRFEVFTAVPMKNDVFWVVTPCGSCKNRRFG